MLDDCIQNLMAQMHIPGMSIALVQAGEPGGQLSTIVDLVKWEQALQQGTLISQSGLEAMWQPQLSTHGNEWEHLGYAVGLGWFVLNYEGRRVVGHNG